jgi:hypothetical protein
MRNRPSVAAALTTFLLGLSGLGALSAQQAAGPPPTPLFTTHRDCLACHNGLRDAGGADVSIGVSWRASMMANSARDPYWQAAVRAEVLDHPELQAAIEDACATCHMPMARFMAAAHGGRGEVFANLAGAGLSPRAEGGASPVVPASELAALALDGVSCALCHQIQPDGLGGHESFSGGFVVDRARAPGERLVFGPYEIEAGLSTIMRSSSQFVPEQATHLQESELCASCHTLYTEFTDRAGRIAGELPEQVPYLEWLHSDYRDSRSCQDCHMPVAAADAPISSVLGEPREAFSRHVFRGGNSYMLRVLRRYRDDLGVVATDEELAASIEETDRNLQSNAGRVRLEGLRRSGSRLEAEVVIENLTGHKLPSAYPSRRAWLYFAVRTAGGALLFESGAPGADGSIAGNDNDADGRLFEPHYQVIDSGGQVQVYESIMVDTEGEVTTGLLFGSRYVKDNRLLPAGFDKRTASADIAVQGAAAVDVDFTGGGDRVRYSVELGDAGGDLVVEVQLVYQTIAFRWARNLNRHAAPEIGRFLGYYDATAGESPVVLASDRADVPAVRPSR